MLPHRVLKTKALAKYALQPDSKHFTSLFLFFCRFQQKQQKLRKKLLLFLLLSLFFVARSLNELVAALWQQNTKTKCFLSSHLPFWSKKWYDVFVFCRCCFYCHSVVSFHIKSCALWPTCVEFTLPQSGTVVVLQNFVFFFLFMTYILRIRTDIWPGYGNLLEEMVLKKILY